MRFFHLSDLHLGKHLHHYNLKDDQIHILKEIATYACTLHPDAIVIAGDIYDKSVPSAEAVAMFDAFLTELSAIEPAIPILMIAGNHDSGERLEYAGEILGQHHIYIAGKPPVAQDQHLKKVTLEDEYGSVHFYLLPFLRPSYVKNVLPQENLEDYTQAVKCLLEREAPDYTQRNVLVSHQFYTGNGQQPQTCDSELVNVGGLDNVDISAVQNFDYVALGHLHGSQQVGLSHIRYCGTMLKYSVSEASHEKSLTMVTLHAKGKPVQIEKLPLHPLRDVQKKKGLLEDILKEGKGADGQNYVSVTLTNEEELYKPREQLTSVYPFLLEVRVDNERTRRQMEDMGELIEVRSPLELYQDFYREVHGTDLKEEGVELMRKILDEIKGEW